MGSLPASIESAAARLLRVRGIRGLAVGAFDRDGVLFAEGVGYADLEAGRLATSRTVFRVASISKLATATLILRLADEGQVDLDAPVVDLLPADLQPLDAEGRPAPSTVASLLSHSSGLPAGIRGVDAGNPVLSRLLNQGRVDDLASSIRGLRLTHPPDDRVVYSNPAFNLLGYVAARIAGRSFEAAAAEQVLEPLGMVDSAFASQRSGPQVARSYGSLVPPKVGVAPLADFRLLATPMGGLTTTVEDLARFGQMVLAGGRAGDAPFLSPELLGRATTIRATNHPDLEQGFGLGFKVRPWRGRRSGPARRAGSLPRPGSTMTAEPTKQGR